MIRSLFVFAVLSKAGLGSALAAPASGGVNFTLQTGFPWQGFSIFTIVMALLYAGHMAQDRTSLGWRILLFILGFPLTFIVSFLVFPGSQRVLGVDLPRQDQPGGDASASVKERSELEQQQRERKAAWDGTIAFLCGISLVLLLAPSTEYRSQPLDNDRYAVEKTVFWGFWGDPWFSYRREGVQERDDVRIGNTPEWRGEREWAFEATIESVLTLVILLVVFALCVRDEWLRSRALLRDTGSPHRTG